ncbi:hypothetical protein B0T10DRAFT_252695 [Thelonectria olida]|uniref:Secreted protein n=1 Tax=Thelonectria olida TaxID=1576542 RepID=A0A9P8WAX5_9HYPO|nr:hypothetical protein B0T10DRAFT_252695 [Thelonectria olida]
MSACRRTLVCSLFALSLSYPRLNHESCRRRHAGPCPNVCPDKLHPLRASRILQVLRERWRFIEEIRIFCGKKQRRHALIALLCSFNPPRLR